MPNRHTARIVVLAKYPEENKVKTRLAKSLGASVTTRLYSRLLTKTLHELKNMPLKSICYLNPASKIPVFRKKYPWMKIEAQSSGDLGQRMKVAVQKTNANKVIVIGADNPSLNSQTLIQANQLLNKNGVVIGPARDGGYYLMGIHKNALDQSPKLLHILFDHMIWSTKHVLQETIHRLRQSKVSYRLLPKLSDMDEVRDLTPANLDNLFEM